jgi:hypothetical protein
MPPGGRSLAGSLPFPFPLSVGTDICQISRVARILRGNHAARFVGRVLAPGEHRSLDVTLVTTNQRLRSYLRTSPQLGYKRGKAPSGSGLASLVRDLEEEKAAEGVVRERAARAAREKEDKKGEEELAGELDEGWKVDGGLENGGGPLVTEGWGSWMDLAERIRRHAVQVQRLRAQAAKLGVVIVVGAAAADGADAARAAEDEIARDVARQRASWRAPPPASPEEQRLEDQVSLQSEAANVLHRAATFMSGR